MRPDSAAAIPGNRFPESSFSYLDHEPCSTTLRISLVFKWQADSWHGNRMIFCFVFIGSPGSRHHESLPPGTFPVQGLIGPFSLLFTSIPGPIRIERLTRPSIPLSIVLGSLLTP